MYTPAIRIGPQSEKSTAPPARYLSASVGQQHHRAEGEQPNDYRESRVNQRETPDSTASVPLTANHAIAGDWSKALHQRVDPVLRAEIVASVHARL